MLLHPNLLAHFRERTLGAFRQLACADVLAKGNQQAIDFNPIPLRQLGLQGSEGFFGRSGLDKAPAIGNAVNVNVHTDAGLLAGDAQHQIGALGTHSGKRSQGIEIAGQLTIVVGNQSVRDRQNLGGFGFVVGRGLNQSIDLLHAQLADLGWRSGNLQQPGSKPAGWFRRGCESREYRRPVAQRAIDSLVLLAQTWPPSETAALRFAATRSFDRSQIQQKSPKWSPRSERVESGAASFPNLDHSSNAVLLQQAVNNRFKE